MRHLLNAMKERWNLCIFKTKYNLQLDLFLIIIDWSHHWENIHIGLKNTAKNTHCHRYIKKSSFSNLVVMVSDILQPLSFLLNSQIIKLQSRNNSFMEDWVSNCLDVLRFIHFSMFSSYSTWWKEGVPAIVPKKHL